MKLIALTLLLLVGCGSERDKPECASCIDSYLDGTKAYRDCVNDPQQPEGMCLQAHGGQADEAFKALVRCNDERCGEED